MSERRDERGGADRVSVGKPLTEVDLTRLQSIREYVTARSGSSRAGLAGALRSEFPDPSRVWVRSHRPGSVLVVQRHREGEGADGPPEASLYRVTREQRADGGRQFCWSLIGPVE